MKDKYHMISPICGILKKKKLQMNFFHRTETNRLLKTCGYQRGQLRGWEGWTGDLGLADPH